MFLSSKLIKETRFLKIRMDILEEFNWIDRKFLRNRPIKAIYSNEKNETWERELGRQQERQESCENVSDSRKKQDPTTICPRDIKGRRSDNRAEIEIIELCDSEELHEEKSIPNLCGMVNMKANIPIPQDEKIITASAVVLTDSEIKQAHQVSVNNNYLISNISKIIDRLTVPINDTMPVLAGFDQIISALSFRSMKSCSLVGDSSSKNNNGFERFSPCFSKRDASPRFSANKRRKSDE